MISSLTTLRRRSRPTRSSRNNAAGLLLLVLAAALLVASDAIAQTCPEPLAGARRLILVSSKGLTATTGTARLFERATPQEAWQAVGASEPVVLGRAGMAWGLGFQHLALAGEPKKIEGDGRTPGRRLSHRDKLRFCRLAAARLSADRRGYGLRR